MFKLKWKIENKLLQSESAIGHRFFSKSSKNILPKSYLEKGGMMKSSPASLYSELAEAL